MITILRRGGIPDEWARGTVDKLDLEDLFERGRRDEAVVDRRGGRTSLDRDVADQPMLISPDNTASGV